MQSDQLDIRLRAVRAVNWLFSLRTGSLPDGFDHLHEHFIKRFYDNDAAIRLAMIEGAKKCLLTDHFVGAIEFLCEYTFHAHISDHFLTAEAKVGR